MSPSEGYNSDEGALFENSGVPDNRCETPSGDVNNISSKVSADSPKATKTAAKSRELKMIVAAYAIREESLHRKAATSQAEARRLQVVLDKQIQESATKRRRENKQMAAALEKQAALKDQVNVLTVEIQKIKSDYEKKHMEETHNFQKDLDQIESTYRAQVEEVRLEQQIHSESADYHRVRSREEITEAVRSQERDRLESLYHKSQQTRKQALEEIRSYHSALLAKEQNTSSELKTELTKLRKAATEEVLTLRKQVEYLFEYSRNVSRIVQLFDPSKHIPGISLFNRKKYRKTQQLQQQLSQGAFVTEPLDLSLLPHIQNSWFKTSQYLSDTKNYKAPNYSSFNLMNFPLSFVSAADFQDTTIPRGMWSVRQPKKEAVETLIKSLERHVEMQHQQSASPPPQQTECQKCAQREAEDISVEELLEQLERVKSEKDRYQQQFQSEVARSREMKIALESKGREIQKLRLLMECVPKRPPASRSSTTVFRPQSAGSCRPQSAGATRPKSAGMTRSHHYPQHLNSF